MLQPKLLPRALPALLPIALMLGCAPQIAATNGDASTSTDGGSTGGDTTGGTADTGSTGTTTTQTNTYDGATLEIISPVSGEFYGLSSDIDFIAQIIAADGSELDFDDISWTSSVDVDWSGSGRDFQDQLTVGTHAITAVAALPNGDRLGWTVGGVLVQHEDAGTYVGDLAVDFTVDSNGTTVTTTCFGSATVVVDAWGETAAGDSGCTVSLMGYDLDTTYAFDFTLADQQLEGEAALDLVLFESQFPATGSVASGTLLATWDETLLDTVQLAGELDLVRVSRDTDG